MIFWKGNVQGESLNRNQFIQNQVQKNNVNSVLCETVKENQLYLMYGLV